MSVVVDALCKVSALHRVRILHYRGGSTSEKLPSDTQTADTQTADTQTSGTLVVACCYDSDQAIDATDSEPGPRENAAWRFELDEAVWRNVERHAEVERLLAELVGDASARCIPVAIGDQVWGGVLYESADVGHLSPPAQRLIRFLVWCVGGWCLRRSSQWGARTVNIADCNGEAASGDGSISTVYLKDVVIQASYELAMNRPGALRNALNGAGREVGAAMAFVTEWSGSNDPEPAYVVAPGDEGGEADYLETEPVFDLLDDLLERSSDRSGPAVAVPLVSSSGELLGFTGFVFDAFGSGAAGQEMRTVSAVSALIAAHVERVRNERALKQSNDRWRGLLAAHPDPFLTISNGIITSANAAAAEFMGEGPAAQVEGRPFVDFLWADDYGAFEGAIRDLADGDERRILEHELVRLDGDVRFVESCLLRDAASEDASIHLVMRDVTKRRTVEEEQERFFETISEGVLQIAVRNPCSVDLPHSDQVEHILGAGRVVETNEEMDQILKAIGGSLTVDGVHSLFGDATREVLTALVDSDYNLRNREFTVGDRTILLNALGTPRRGKLVSVWVSCIDVSQNELLETTLLLALENQKQSIGRDLHDGVGQLLTAVCVLSRTLAGRYETAGFNEAELPERVARMADDAARHMRHIFSGLTPTGLHDAEFEESVDRLVDLANSVHDARCILIKRSEIRIQDETRKLHLYRIIQEAIHNAEKHSKGNLIRVVLDQDADHDIIRVSDNGVGFDTDAPARTSIGMQSMRYRARALHADLFIESNGNGTVIECRVPVSL
jgi:PAS domain S-box-containing protein